MAVVEPLSGVRKIATAVRSAALGPGQRAPRDEPGQRVGIAEEGFEAFGVPLQARVLP